MLSLKGFLLVMLKSAFIVALLSIPKPAVAFSGLKNWSRKALYTKVDLCTQSCYSQIIPGLYLSNARAAADRNVLTSLGITHVLTIEAHKLPKATFEDTNISTLFIRAYDLPQAHILPYFPMANAFIEEGLKKGNVMVHCHFGVSRSATIVIAYLMAKYKMTFEQAFIYVRQRRKFINPNSGFVAQLREYQRLNYDVNGLYLSNAKAASDRSLLLRLGITHVLTVEALRLPASTFEKTNMHTLFIMAFDSHDTNLLPYFPLANSFIDEGMRHGKVLVHCRLGVSRSSTIVIAYLMQKYKLTFEQAFRYVRRKRPFINPNPGFVKQLIKYEQNEYYVSHFKRLEAYMKVNSGENKYKMVSAFMVVLGIMLPVAVLLV